MLRALKKSFTCAGRQRKGSHSRQRSVLLHMSECASIDKEHDTKNSKDRPTSKRSESRHSRHNSTASILGRNNSMNDWQEIVTALKKVDRSCHNSVEQAPATAEAEETKSAATEEAATVTDSQRQLSTTSVTSRLTPSATPLLHRKSSFEAAKMEAESAGERFVSEYNVRLEPVIKICIPCQHDHGQFRNAHAPQTAMVTSNNSTQAVDIDDNTNSTGTLMMRSINMTPARVEVAVDPPETNSAPGLSPEAAGDESFKRLALEPPPPSSPSSPVKETLPKVTYQVVEKQWHQQDAASPANSGSTVVEVGEWIGGDAAAVGGVKEEDEGRTSKEKKEEVEEEEEEEKKDKEEYDEEEEKRLMEPAAASEVEQSRKESMLSETVACNATLMLESDNKAETNVSSVEDFDPSSGKSSRQTNKEEEKEEAKLEEKDKSEEEGEEREEEEKMKRKVEEKGEGEKMEEERVKLEEKDEREGEEEMKERKKVEEEEEEEEEKSKFNAGDEEAITLTGIESKQSTLDRETSPPSTSMTSFVDVYDKEPLHPTDDAKTPVSPLPRSENLTEGKSTPTNVAQEDETTRVTSWLGGIMPASSADRWRRMKQIVLEKESEASNKLPAAQPEAAETAKKKTKSLLHTENKEEGPINDELLHILSKLSHLDTDRTRKQESPRHRSVSKSKSKSPPQTVTTVPTKLERKQPRTIETVPPRKETPTRRTATSSDPQANSYSVQLELDATDSVVNSFMRPADRRVIAAAAKNNCNVSISPVDTFSPKTTKKYQCVVNGPTRDHVVRCINFLKDTFPKSYIRINR